MAPPPSTPAPVSVPEVNVPPYSPEELPSVPSPSVIVVPQKKNLPVFRKYFGGGKKSPALPKAPLQGNVQQDSRNADATENSNKNMTKDELMRLKEAEKRYREGMATIRDPLHPVLWRWIFSGFVLATRMQKRFCLFVSTIYWRTGFSPIVNFDVTMDISMFIYPSDSAALKVLRNKVAQMQSSMHMNREKGMVRDPAIEAALWRCGRTSWSIATWQEKFFHFGLYFTIYSDDPITKIKRFKILNHLGGKLVLTLIRRSSTRTWIQLHVLPICSDELDIHRNMNTSPFSTSFPFSSSELTSNEGIFVWTQSSQRFSCDFWSVLVKNANSVFAKSGAGKIVCAQTRAFALHDDWSRHYWLIPKWMKNSRNVVVLALFSKSNQSERRIILSIYQNHQRWSCQTRRSLRQILLPSTDSLILCSGNRPTEETLDRALISTYAPEEFGWTPKIRETIRQPCKIYRSAWRNGRSRITAERLEKYTRGTFSGPFNQRTNIDPIAKWSFSKPWFRR